MNSVSKTNYKNKQTVFKIKKNFQTNYKCGEEKRRRKEEDKNNNSDLQNFELKHSHSTQTPLNCRHDLLWKILVIEWCLQNASREDNFVLGGRVVGVDCGRSHAPSAKPIPSLTSHVP